MRKPRIGWKRCCAIWSATGCLISATRRKRSSRTGSPLITFTTNESGAAAPPRSEGETDMRSKYPNVCVALLGEDENAFAIVERVQRALREAGVPTAEVKAFTVEACSGDYYHLLETVLRTVETT